MKTHSAFVSSYLNRPRMNSLIRAGILVAVIALIGIPLFSSSSASSARKSVVPSGELTPARKAGKTPGVHKPSRATNPLTAWFFQSGIPAIATYDSGCAVADSDFTLGSTICAIATDTGGATFGRHITWVDPSGYIRQSISVSSDPQNDTFVVPGTSTSELSNGVIVKNTGSWRVNLTSSRGSIITSASFVVSDQAAPEVDLVTVKRAAQVQVAAGSEAIYQILVTNLGPDAAESVVVTDAVPLNTTFASLSQSGAAFTCGTPDVGSTGTVTCTIENLPRDASAIFVISYTVVAGATNGSIISNTVSVSSATTEVNPANNSDTVTISVDNSVPEGCVLTCPADITTTANTTSGGNPGAFVTFSSASVSGSCGSVSNDPASGSFFTVGTHTVTATSSSGATCSFTVTVLDTPAPTITCPPNVTATAGEDGTATVSVGTPTYTPVDGTVVGVRSDGQPAVFDEDGNLVTPATTPALTDPYPTGITGITWTVTDADGRTATCRQTVTVNAVCGTDTEPPSITAPADLTVFTGADNTGCSVALDDELGQAVATDNCSVTVTISGIPAGNEFPLGSTTLTYTATDPAGNTDTATQVVTVVDNTLPVIAAPADASYTCPSEVPAASASQATGGTVLDGNGNPLPPGPPTDNCGVPVVTVSETSTGSGSAASPLIITRTFTATDASNNSSSAVQTITVTDSAAPTITAPADVTAYTGPGATSCDTVVSNATLGTASAEDNCAGVTVSRSPSGNTFPVGNTTVTWTATDWAGNTATATQTVTVLDNTAPVVTPPANVTAYTGAGATSCGTTVSDATLGTATASDNCPGVGAISRTGVPSGNVFPVGDTTVTYSVTDANGNSSSATQTVTVIDNTPPVISCPPSITLEPTCPTGAIATWTAPVGTDNCPGASTSQTGGQASGSVFPIGTSTVTYTTNDAHGNSTSCSFTVTVLTPQAVIQNLMTSVGASSLTGTQKNGLLAKLQATLDALNTGQTNVACNKLDAFINSVENLVSHGDLSATQGQAWINSANHVRNTIGCTNNPCT